MKRINHKRMQNLFILLLFLLATCACPAQRTPDTAPVTVRKISAEKIDRYRTDPTFQYEQANETAPSYWDRFWDWIWSKIGSLTRTPHGARVTRILLIAVASGLLLYFIIRLSGMNRTGLFGKKNTGDLLQGEAMNEDIHSINFNQAIQQAVANSNYRLAVRLLYLQSLKALADRDMILWQLDKTNSAYVKEIKDESQQNAFYQLTLWFENNWYGNIPVSEARFGLIKDQFERFNKQFQ